MRAVRRRGVVLAVPLTRRSLVERHACWLWLIGAWLLAEFCLLGRVFGAEPPVDVQGLLVARCASCHGRTKRDAGLSLVERERLIAPLSSGNRAVVPGKPEQSELLRRVMATDVSERMPPHGAPLNATEISALRKWIEAGASWESPWAYRPLRDSVPPQLPPAAAARTRTSLDAWIEQGLARHELTPVGPADRRTFLRRLSLDLLGLPPTLDEVAAYVNDPQPDATVRVVDRLLASPHLGERWARHWMDVVHFAETHGHDQDRPRPNAWPYRDYLIRAFNADRPYAEFVAQQVAGDVLDPANPDAIVATGFLATGPWDESSLRDIRDDTLDRQIARYLDRDDIVSTAMGTFVSTTVHCARCHDHKFDPVSQTDYYRLQAVFAGTDKAEREYDADPAVARRRQQLEQELAQLDVRRAAGDQAWLQPETKQLVAQWEAALARTRDQWQVLTPAEARSSGGATLTIQSDGSILSSGSRPEKDTYTITARVKVPRVTGLRLEVLTDASLPHQGPGRQDNGNLHLSELVVTATSGEGANATSRRVALKQPRADFDQEGWTIAHALDNNPATAWGIYPQVGKPHRAVVELAEPMDASAGVTLVVELRQLHGGGHLIGRPRLSVTSTPAPLPLDAATLPAAIASILSIPDGQRTAAQRFELTAYVLRQKYEDELNRLPKRQLVYAGTSRFKPDGSFRPAEKPRPVHVLKRGDIKSPGTEVSPGTLGMLPGLPSDLAIANPLDEGQRRAALAHWLVDPRNALTWRSIVNRLWQYHFGRGIVDTPNDFGAMGGTPSHPELLDHLASQLQRRGGSLKALHRELVLSAAYGRSSEHRAEHAARDADNRLLWRMNRGRLDAESVRDSLLVLSETLNGAMGGPSDKQFIMSPGVHVTPVVDYVKFDPSDPANYRRSVYRFVFRTLPDPFLEALDCVDASQWAPTRSVSVTALQALALLNDKFVVRQCEHLAERIEAEHTTLEGRVRRLVQVTLLREPLDEELAALVPYVQQHGLENACRWLVNSNEFVFID